MDNFAHGLLAGCAARPLAGPIALHAAAFLAWTVA